jgi:Uma2 family endonuclease
MTAALKYDLQSPEEYLLHEESGEVRHEYLGGMVYAMAGSSDDHSIIAGNIFAEIRQKLRGGPCKIFIGDMKARLLIGTRDVFYYPDVLVTCDPRDTEKYFKRFPKLIIEVLSETTANTDRREKLWNYTQMESLEEYVLIAQDEVEVTVFRRASHWEAETEVISSKQMDLRLKSLDLAIPLKAIYDGVL